MPPAPRPDTYSVLVRFRKRHLALRRRIPSLREALTFAEEVKSARLRDPDSVFIVHDPTGDVVEDTGDHAPSGARSISGELASEALIAAEHAIERVVTLVRHARGEGPAVELDAIIEKVEEARLEIATARASAGEQPGEPKGSRAS